MPSRRFTYSLFILCKLPLFSLCFLSLCLIFVLFFLYQCLCFHFLLVCLYCRLFLKLLFVFFDPSLVCLFYFVCPKSSLGRGSIGRSYLLALTTLLVPNAEQEIYLFLFILCLLPLFSLCFQSYCLILHCFP